MAHQQADGDLFIGPPGMAYLYSHAIGTMALCEAYGLSADPSLKQPPTRAIEFIVDSQDPARRRLAVFPGTVRRYIGLRLEDLRPPERPPRRDQDPQQRPESVLTVSRPWRPPTDRA